MKNQSNMKPILFSTPMVQAILEGRKTQTRRIIKPQPILKENNWWTFGKHMELSSSVLEGNIHLLDLAKYQPGDILYVRETWMYLDVKTTWDDDEPSEAQILYKASYDLKPDGVSNEEFGATQWIQVTHEKAEEIEGIIDDMEQEGDRWKPSIFMPKAAARIFLKVTDVRAERLHDITEAYAIAEGVEMYSPGNWKGYGKDPGNFGSPVASFASLWKSINGSESWNQNPWVFAYTFERCEKPQ